MGSTGKAGRGGSLVREEEIKGTPLIFGEARVFKDFVDIDGYSNKATLKGALGDLAKAIAKYDEGEAKALRDSIKFNEIDQVKPTADGGPGQYILEYEEVPSASRYINDEDIEYKEGKWYLHTRIIRSR